jgi:hypothetical protein
VGTAPAVSCGLGTALLSPHRVAVKGFVHNNLKKKKKLMDNHEIFWFCGFSQQKTPLKGIVREN